MAGEGGCAGAPPLQPQARSAPAMAASSQARARTATSQCPCGPDRVRANASVAGSSSRTVAQQPRRGRPARGVWAAVARHAVGTDGWAAPAPAHRGGEAAAARVPRAWRGSAAAIGALSRWSQAWVDCQPASGRSARTKVLAMRFIVGEAPGRRSAAGGSGTCSRPDFGHDLLRSAQ